jgi:molybdopterin-guanine dinucleotide biosynthesis protein A
MEKSVPPVYGLVLAGGKSSRMGKDKATLRWHGKEQQYYIADLLRAFCTKVYISVRKDQEASIDPGYAVLPDAYPGLGQYGAILTAQAYKPDVAWLVLACDLPLLDAQTLEYLMQHRADEAIATTFESPFDHLPEPLIAIWEPRSNEQLLNFREKGFTCPRKVLLNTELVSILQPPDPESLMNVNTPEQAKTAQDILNRRKAGIYER